MRPTTPADPRTATLVLLATLALAGVAHPAAAQTVKGQSLAGDWVRTDSNNDPNDLMRITVSGSTAVLTSVPAPALPHWKVGDVLWQSIQANGTLRIRGSDGNYYPSTITWQGTDILHIDIQHTGAGNDQTWERAWPAIDGDWVQVAPSGSPMDGTRVQAQGRGGTIGYLPGSAPRRYRIGSRLWQNLSAGGAMQVLGSDGQYHPATVTVIDPNQLRIDSNAPQVASGQLWVRPSFVVAARAALRTPPANPNQPGGSLKAPGNLPAVPTTPAAPPVPPAPAAPACIATSLPHDQTGVAWGWGLTSATDDDPREETLGIREHMIPDFQSGLGNVPVDIERSRLPGFADGFGFVWQRMSRRVQYEEGRDLTAGEYDRKAQAARAAGLRAVDIEAYDTPAGMRYAGVWATNTEGLAWQADYDLTGQAFGQAFQNLRNGHRLVDIEAYETPNGIRYAAIWYASCDDTNWREVRDMGRSGYQSRVDSLAALGFRVIDFESYRTPNGQRYAAIWERIPAGRGWAVRTDRDLDWFLNYHRQYVDEGMRLIDYESYDTANGTRYAGIWAENDRRYDFALKAAVDDSIQTYRSTHGIPGISVVVMRDDEVIYRRGFGWADSARQKMADAETVYLTASVAKVIAADIAARMEQRGALDLGKRTTSFLDYLPTYHTHTVEQLLSKTGCVRHYPEGTEPDTTRVYAFRRPALSQMWPDSMLSNCTPGMAYHYSTHGFTYVGAVLEEVSGQPIADVIADELTRPFGLTSMRPVTSGRFGGFGGLGVRPYHLARGYSWSSANGSQPANYENTTWKVLGGGLQTNALDLARFGQLTRENTIADTTRLWTPLASNATTPWWDTTQTGTVPTVGLAWVLGTANGGRRIAQHGGVTTGGWGGGRSHLRVYRDDRIVIAILTNQRETKATIPSMNLNPGDAHPVWSLSTAIAGAVFANPPPP